MIYKIFWQILMNLRERYPSKRIQNHQDFERKLKKSAKAAHLMHEPRQEAGPHMPTFVAYNKHNAPSLFKFELFFYPS
jgi:hypothetical protein